MKNKLATVTTSFLVMALSVGAVAPASAATIAPTPAITAAIGDSMSRGAAADGTRNLQPENSWTTGTGNKVNSHYKRLTAASGKTITPKNFAVSGSHSVDLKAQAVKASAAKANYVTVVSGANDICGASSVSALPTVSTYKTNVRNALTALNAGTVKPKILVGSVPSLLSLYNAGKSQPAALAVWSAYDMCGVMLGNATDTSVEANDRRATVEEHVQDFNKALNEVCAEYSNCYFDDNAIYNINFTYADLSSLDHFHPSISGQNKVAAATWEKVVAKNMFSTGGITPVASTSTTTVVKVSPKITIVAPTTNTVSGVLTLKVKATSDTAIKTVILKNTASDNLALTKKADGFWYLSIDTRKIANGKVYAQVKATDADRDLTTTRTITLTVNN
jgi:lysophospholipase L1-like esterase